MRGTRSQAGTGRGQSRGTGGGVSQNRQGRGTQNPPRPPARQQQIIPPAQANPQAPAFALTPALAKRGILDYETRAGERIYEAATKPLDTKEKYDGESSGLYQFLELLKERARNHGWDDGIMSIPGVIAGGTPSQLLSDYGTIDLKRIKTYEETYIDTACRQAQDSNLLYECIMKSLASECKDKVTIWKKHYFAKGLPSGNLLLKVLIRECYLDTNATSGAIRKRLSSLDTYLPTVGYNITKFNLYVAKLIQQLRARGESSNDLLINLFTGYLAATDKSFTAYIEKKLETYEEGTPVTPDQLMLWARNKYDLLLDKGLWNAPTEEEEKILALSAKIKQMENRWKKGGEKSHDKKSPTENSTTNSPPIKREREKKKELPDWFATQPKDVNKPITWNKKEWHWCGKATGGKCEKFTRHKPNQCRGIKPNTKKIKAPKIKVEQSIVDTQEAKEDDDGFELV